MYVLQSCTTQPKLQLYYIQGQVARIEGGLTDDLSTLCYLFTSSGLYSAIESKERYDGMEGLEETAQAQPHFTHTCDGYNRVYCTVYETETRQLKLKT